MFAKRYTTIRAWIWAFWASYYQWAFSGMLVGCVPLHTAVVAMQLQLKTVYGSNNNELAPEVYRRHEAVAQYCRKRVKKMDLKLWWDDNHAHLNSASVTAIRVPDNTTWEELDQKLRQEGVVFGGSDGQTVNALFRIGHMGTQADLETVTYALDVLEKTVSQQ
ncbi:hypothetical protein BGX29_000152 [Mortierella sp. GBA35]|nr:hypothetical protein BGX29_000152 [Mortierella sp. GBA35]